VTFFLGLKFAGIYFLYWSFANAAATLVSLTVLHVQRPLLIKAHHQGGPPLHRKLTAGFAKVTVLASVAFGAAIGLVFHVILPFLDQSSFAGHLAAFWLLNAAMVVRNMADFGAMALFTAHRDRLMTLTNIAAVLMLAVTQALLLPVAGLYGAGGAILVTFTGIAMWRFRAIFGRWYITPTLRRIGA
jgi:O-antigen/teichoic acid export membrane protein